jgi:hypothetical protein
MNEWFNQLTYELGYNFLKNCNKIEHWGCSESEFKKYIKKDHIEYIGIDNSIEANANIKADLCEYTSSVDGIFMRDVLEHNSEWKKILQNACKSFNKKMCLILFKPLSDVPNTQLNKNEVFEIFGNFNIMHRVEVFETKTIIYLYKTKVDFAFYTCFYGGDNNPAFKIPETPSLNYDCYYYTNNTTILEKLKNTKWIPVYDDKPISQNYLESSMISKHIKALPNEYKELNKYPYVCYLDSKLNKVDEKFVEKMIIKYFVERDYSLLLREHWYLDNNVWNEYYEGVKQERYRIEKDKYQAYIKKQIENGLSEVTERHSASGFLIRNMKHIKMNEINRTWYQHIQESGILDQISFFFVKQLFDGYIYSFNENPFEKS